MLISHTKSWILDSDAMVHITACLELLFNFKFDRNFTVKITNRSVMKVVWYGTVRINNNIIIHEVLFVPDYKSNLLYVNKLSINQNY